MTYNNTDNTIKLKSLHQFMQLWGHNFLVLMTTSKTHIVYTLCHNKLVKHNQITVYNATLPVLCNIYFIYCFVFCRNQFGRFFEGRCWKCLSVAWQCTLCVVINITWAYSSTDQIKWRNSGVLPQGFVVVSVYAVLIKCQDMVVSMCCLTWWS